MAEKRQGQRTSQKRQQESGGEKNRTSERRSTRRPSGAQLAKSARDELAEITGFSAESVTSLEQVDDDTWKVRVELLEVERVPDTDDVLGSYEVQLDGDGGLLGYRRVRRYPRSHAGEDDAVGGTP
ncbi:MAG: gas vesicle protein [Streptosporangiales bacterium]|nr:gas vesicle protein [Streptosporangiales bacterium]